MTDFEGGDISTWLLSPGWTLATEGENTILTTSAAGEAATLNGLLWDQVSINAQVRVSGTDAAHIGVRVGSLSVSGLGVQSQSEMGRIE